MFKADYAKCVFYRSPTAVDDLAVRPITQFPITLDDEVRVYTLYKSTALECIRVYVHL